MLEQRGLVTKQALSVRRASAASHFTSSVQTNLIRLARYGRLEAVGGGRGAWPCWCDVCIGGVGWWWCAGSP